MKTEEKCPSNDYIFDPIFGVCQRGDGDATCPSRLLDSGFVDVNNGLFPEKKLSRISLFIR